MNATVQTQSTTATPSTSIDTSTESLSPENKLRSFTISSTKETQTIEFVLQNEKGLPYNLSNLTGVSLKGLLSESIEGSQQLSLTVTVKTAASGVLNISIPSIKPGVYRGVVTLSANNVSIIANPFLIYVANTIGMQVGPPSLLEVRLQIRDSSPNDNLLLDSVAFTDEEISLAAIRPIQYFNEVSPHINALFTTNNFPWRYHWIEGMVAQLYMIAAEHYRKNNLSYSAGGLSVADMDKERNYMAAYQEKWGMYMQFVRNKKGEINMAQGWSTISGIYSFF